MSSVTPIPGVPYLSPSTLTHALDAVNACLRNARAQLVATTRHSDHLQEQLADVVNARRKVLDEVQELERAAAELEQQLVPRAGDDGLTLRVEPEEARGRPVPGTVEQAQPDGAGFAPDAPSRRWG